MNDYINQTPFTIEWDHFKEMRLTKTALNWFYYAIDNIIYLWSH